MAHIKAFLALEGTIAAVMLTTWQAQARDILQSIQGFIHGKQWQAAYDAVAKLDFVGVVSQNRARLEELCIAAVLHGASQVVPLRNTSFMTVPGPLPSIVPIALHQLEQMVERDASTFIRQIVMDVISTAQDQASLAKADLIKEADLGFIDQLNAAAMGTGKALINVSANLTTSRLISFGFLAEAAVNNIDSYEVVEILDDKICPVCEEMHGKVFQVDREKALLDQVLATQDPQQLRLLQPWPSQTKAGIADLKDKSNEQLQAEGLGSPPYHPLCRGVLSLLGTETTTLPPVSSPIEPQSELLGPDLSPSN